MPADADGSFHTAEARYRAMIECAPEAIILMDIESGLFIEANPAAERIFGLTREELLQRGPAELSPPAQPDGRDSRAGAIAHVVTAFESGTTLFEWTHLHATRGPILCRVHLAAVPSPPRRFLRGTIVDLSEPERQRDRLQRVIDAAPDIIGMADGRGRTIYLNPAGRRQLGYALDEDLRGTEIAQFHTPEGARTIMEEAVPAAVREGTWHGLTEFRSREGRVIPTSQVLIAHMDRAGELEYVSTIARDMTAARAAEDLERRMLQAQKLESLGVLAGGIAHDFNNILFGVIANAGLLVRRLPPGSEEAAMARDAQRSAERAAELARQMLAYAGKARIERRALTIAELVHDVGELVKASLSKSTQVRFELEPAPQILGDAAQLRQVLMNLLVNASEALGERPGSVVVRTRYAPVDRARLLHDHLPAGMTGPVVHVEVRDDGDGMTPEVLRMIFDPFFTTKFTGRGLGLAAVLGIIRAHDGGIRVESSPGNGTVFDLVFPVVAAEAGRPVAPAAARPSQPGLVLVIDDEPLVRGALRRILQLGGYSTLEAEDGPAGIALVERHAELSAVVLDVTMPGMSGLEVLEHLRARFPRLPILLSSGLGELSTTLADGFLAKPYAPDAILEALALAVRGRASRS